MEREKYKTLLTKSHAKLHDMTTRNRDLQDMTSKTDSQIARLTRDLGIARMKHAGKTSMYSQVAQKGDTDKKLIRQLMRENVRLAEETAEAKEAMKEMMAGGGHATDDALGEAEEVAEIVQELNHLKTRVARLKLDNTVCDLCEQCVCMCVCVCMYVCVCVSVCV